MSQRFMGGNRVLYTFTNNGIGAPSTIRFFYTFDYMYSEWWYLLGRKCQDVVNQIEQFCEEDVRLQML